LQEWMRPSRNGFGHKDELFIINSSYASNKQLVCCLFGLHEAYTQLSPVKLRELSNTES
jgi:hypothetical protein